MKTLDFTLSDFDSLQKELCKEFGFLEISHNYFQPKENSRACFFKRVFIESGLEVWILSTQFSDDILLKQNSSNKLFNAIHFFDFDGQFYESEFSKNYQPSKGIYITSSNTNLNFKVKANKNISIVSFIYSKRWLEINLSDTLHFKNLFDTTYSLRKYFINEVFEQLLLNIKRIAQNNKNNSFILKINIFVLLNSALEFIDNQTPSQEQTQQSINDLIIKVEEILSTDFEIPINKINTKITENGFGIKEFVEAFKEKNTIGLFEFRKLKKIEVAVKLLEDGYKIREVAQKIGFKTDSKFIAYFRKEYGQTPYQYTKTFKAR